MAPLDFSPAQAAASMAEGQPASVPIQSLLMQIDADAVCLVTTQFQQLITMALPPLRQLTPDAYPSLACPPSSLGTLDAERSRQASIQRSLFPRRRSALPIARCPWRACPSGPWWGHSRAE